LEPWECIKRYSCTNEGANQVLTVSDVVDQAQCQDICQKNTQCTFFTYYDNTSAPGLHSTCFLFSECDRRSRDCSGCWSGPGQCSSCSTPPAHGGRWYCQKEEDEQESKESEKCFYTCGAKLQVDSVCQGGVFDVAAGKAVCPCRVPDSAGVVCDQGVGEDGQYPGGTSCSLACSGRENSVARCEDGDWKGDLWCSSEDMSMWVVAGLSVVGGLVVITGLVVVYLLYFKTFSAGIKRRKHEKRIEYLPTIDAYREPKMIEHLESEKQQQTEDNQRQASPHYHFERLDQRQHQLGGGQPGQHHARLYQQSRHLYQARGGRPGVSDQPLSRGTSLSEHQI